MTTQSNKTSCNGMFSTDESRRLEKALTAFRRGPTYGNVVRITKAVKAVSDECYVENILTSFVQSIGDSPRYAEYIQSFNELLEN